MRLAAVMLEECPGRTVQLADDHALGAIDDERAGRGHERNLTHVHLLLLHFLGRRFRRLFVEDHQAHLGAQRTGVGQPALLALTHVKRRLAERERNELESREARMADDREDRGKRRLQALVLAMLRRNVRLQERSERFELRRDQKRHVQHGGALREALADTFTLSKGIRHECSRSKSAAAPAAGPKSKPRGRATEGTAPWH